MEDSRAGCSDAKRAGRHVELRPDWEHVRKAVMLQVVLGAFLQNPDLAALLEATGDAVLVEGNRWGDDYWGAVPFPHRPTLKDGTLRLWKPERGAPDTWLAGHNYLGRILMSVRDVVRTD